MSEKEMRKEKRQKGFSLVEIIITIAIMGILAAVVGPNVQPWLTNMRLKAAARDLYSDMQKVRMEAVKNNRRLGIVFDTVNNRYLICTHPGADANWSTIADNSIREVIDLNLKKVNFGHGNVPAGNSATTPPGAFPPDEVSYTSNVATFNSRGTGDSGYVYLDNADGTAYSVGSQSSGVIMMKRWFSSTTTPPGGWQ